MLSVLMTRPLAFESCSTILSKSSFDQMSKFGCLGKTDAAGRTFERVGVSAYFPKVLLIIR